MKKSNNAMGVIAGTVTIVLIVIVYLVVFLALSEEDNAPQKEIVGETIIETSTPQKTFFGLNESAVFDKLKFTATEITESTGEEFYFPSEGKVFVGIKFTIENISSKEQDVSSILLFDSYCDDIKVEYSLLANTVFDGTIDGTLAPGKKMVGYYTVEVPKEWNTIELEVKQNWLSNNSATFMFNK